MRLNIFGKQFNIVTHLRDKIELFLTDSSLSKALSGMNRSVIFVRAVTRKILEHYDGSPYQRVGYHSGSLGYGFIHYSLILNLKPDRVLCIGSRKGFVPAVCALACQENGKGIVDFVDAGYDETHPKGWGGVGFWKKVDPIKHFSFLDVNKFLKTNVMTTQEFANKYKYTYEYIYIDGDHSYSGVKKDFQLFWPRLKKYGFMLFHDISVKQEEGIDFGVWKFWRELKNKNKISFDFYLSGLGILQKS